jgi:hypothetical protein
MLDGKSVLSAKRRAGTTHAGIEENPRALAYLINAIHIGLP